ncbi:MAG: hypothetical protein K2L11_06145, partial [Muribaculaceae bacterium]|nr:hypothetical protein [Muribaculaceae bacterium]
MKRLSLSTLLGGLLIASAGITANAAPALPTRGQDKNPLSRMRRAAQTERWSSPLPTGIGQQRVSPHYTTPMSDSFEYVYAPDGSVWYAITNFETEDVEHESYTEHLLKGFTITFYDSNFNEVGQVRDKIELYEGETRCVQAIVASQLTKKFFNIDDSIEVMVSFAMNTPEYVTHTRTKAYQIKKLGTDELSESLKVIEGYPVDEVNCAKDRWSENFYITFFNQEQPSDSEEFPNYVDYLAKTLQVLTTYGKGFEPVMEQKISLLNLPGDQMNSPMMLSKNVNGKLTLTYAQYEKSFFVDPTGMGGNEAITPDNHLIIDIYQMNDDYPQKMELLSTTKIETTQNTDNKDVYYTFYGIGNLSWEEDVDFTHYTTDGRAAFVVSVDDYLLSDDDHYNSSYYVYDADGNRINTISENTYDRIRMSDIPGFEPQVMFVHMGDDMNFEFVDLYSCRTVTEVDQVFRGHTLSVSTDRVLCGDSYIYGSALSYGIAIDDDELGAPVCWFDTQGELVRLDIIPTGKGTELAQIYISGDALNPFIFNTDEDIEYMMLVKRKVDGRDSLREELIIATPQKGVIQTFIEEEGKGAIRSVYLMTGAAPELLIIFMDDDYKYTTDAYSLPFSKFAGGSGTESDPYLIATGGDLQQMKSEPSAFYKLIADIDCGSMSFNPIDQFSGTLDGDGHTISNLRLSTIGSGKTGSFNYTDKATVKDIDFYNASLLLSGGY